MELKTAETIAGKIKELLQPSCVRVEVAGSIRRRRLFVHDIDLVVIPGNQGAFLGVLSTLGTIKVKGQKLLRVDPSRYGVPVDVYVATSETWVTLLLIRTGSAGHNVKLCKLARSKGMILHADGRGLVHPGDNEIALESPVLCDTEESIFKALGLPYVPPEKREV